ncbi:MAG: hypothetical protein M3Y17_02315 [Actinomycetota bacterium]|nr:hypothetical protein [Actinomycetota bacterium]
MIAADSGTIVHSTGDYRQEQARAPPAGECSQANVRQDLRSCYRGG